MNDAVFAFVIAAVCACMAWALVAVSEPPKPIRADPPPVAWCVQTKPQVVFPESDTYDIPPTEQQLRRGGFYTFYPCKLLKKEQDV